jgi:predicted HicB family RNase H-like nuclease
MNNQTLKHRGYEGSIEPSIEDDCFHGRVLFVRDHITYGGNTLPELTECFREAVDDYLETCAELKKDPDKPFSGQFQVRISQDVHRDAVRAAYHLDMSLNQFVQKAIEEKLKTQETIRREKHMRAILASEVLPYTIEVYKEPSTTFVYSVHEEVDQWARCIPAKISH